METLTQKIEFQKVKLREKQQRLKGNNAFINKFLSSGQKGNLCN